MTIKRWMLGGLITTILLISACSDSAKKEPVEPEEKIKKESTEKVDASKEEKEEEKETKEEDKESEEEVEEDKGDTNEILNPYIAEVTGGDVELVAMDPKPGLKHDFNEKVSIEIDDYQIVRVTNMNESAKAEFQGESEGYVLTYKMTLTNNLTEDVFFNASTMLEADNGHENLYMKAHFTDREDWIQDRESDVVRKYSKGKSFTGMQSYAMSKEQFQRLTAPTLTITQPFLEDDTSKVIGEPAVFKLPFSNEGVEKATASGQLYNDKMVTDSVANKELIFSKEDMDVTKKIDTVSITLNGVQFAKVVPTEGHANRFSGFGEGPIIALTAKFMFENNSDVAFSKFLIEKKLNFERSDKSGGMLRSEGMLEPSVQGEILPGDKEEILAVFLFREEEFEQLKKLQLEIGPLKNEQAKALYKEETATFILPPIN